MQMCLHHEMKIISEKALTYRNGAKKPLPIYPMSHATYQSPKKSGIKYKQMSHSCSPETLTVKLACSLIAHPNQSYVS